MKKEDIKINKFLITVIIFCVAIQVFLVNKHSTIGDQLTSIDKKIEEVENENNRISQKVASLSAMATIAQKASEYGLVSASKILSLTNSFPLAANLKLSL